MKKRTLWITLAASVTSFLIGYFAACLVRSEPNRELDEHREQVETTDYSFTNVSVLCWVMTSQENLFSRAIHITQTWGGRCNLTLYVTEGSPNRPFPGIVLTLPVGKGRNELWMKTRAAFTLIYERYYADYDWFMKVDDDTFVIVDNLRYLLASKNTSEPLYYGFSFRHPQFNLDYTSGGSGYVLGKEALSRFVKVAYDESVCPSGHSVAKAAEDLMMGLCLSAAGVRVGNSLDSQGRIRFLVFTLDNFIDGNIGDWLPRFIAHNITTGIDCCSSYAVSMHYVQPSMMYLLEFLTQHLRLASESKDHNYQVNGTQIPI
ncbi:glycoprotein-N-acetylgalactosamine 3-beta-galactosyltransferase 1-like [Apostichopus japonicus]|uniref:glycoprotein-N-acetylgalactosamine 3-beta-galactosyltransferase 1-like n=1 Tax=Stichopus japonicus TaxID=307972 RepID=UPI003AB4ABE4